MVSSLVPALLPLAATSGVAAAFSGDEAIAAHDIWIFLPHLVIGTETVPDK